MKQPNTRCAHCGEEIYKRPSHLKRYNISFCNRKCQNAHARKNSTYTEETCSECGETFQRNNTQKRKSKSGLYFCSKTCGNRYKAKQTKEKNKKKVYKRHTNIRQELLERDNHTCQGCGYSDEPRMLDLHHIDMDHSNNIKDNLVTLCVWCHTKIHRLNITLDELKNKDAM